jgi:septation ring formation regulator EzrA
MEPKPFTISPAALKAQEAYLKQIADEQAAVLRELRRVEMHSKHHIARLQSKMNAHARPVKKHVWRARQQSLRMPLPY